MQSSGDGMFGQVIEKFPHDLMRAGSRIVGSGGKGEVASRLLIRRALHQIPVGLRARPRLPGVQWGVVSRSAAKSTGDPAMPRRQGSLVVIRRKWNEKDGSGIRRRG